MASLVKLVVGEIISLHYVGADKNTCAWCHFTYSSVWVFLFNGIQLLHPS